MSFGKERHGHSQSDRERSNTELAVLKGFGGDLTSTEDVIGKIGPTWQRLGKEGKHNGEGCVDDGVFNCLVGIAQMRSLGSTVGNSERETPCTTCRV